MTEQQLYHPQIFGASRIHANNDSRVCSEGAFCPTSFPLFQGMRCFAA
jgi:hypothetical protein